MSDDQNKPGSGGGKDQGGGKLPGPLPGLGGAKPGGGAPLPGLGGGAKPGGGAPLPGLGGAQEPKPVVPPFMQQQQQQQQQPPGPDPEQQKRDPFAADNLPAQRPSYRPDEGLIGADASTTFSESEAGKSRKPLVIVMIVLAVVALGLGFMGGKAVSGRVALNIAIRDALIVEYEIKQAAALFDEIEGVVNTALRKAAKREYDEKHLGFLSDKLKGNPVKPQIFTERNYRNFDAAAVQWLNKYYNKWGDLYDEVEEHRRKTRNDEKVLTAAREEFEKLLKTNYGVVFARDEEKGGQFVANLVVLGASEEDDGETLVQVQQDTGTYGDERKLYNPEPGDKKLTEEPEEYVVLVGDNSKAGVLKNATQSHFDEYSKRLREMSDLMKGMRDTQQNLLNKLAEIASQAPVSLLGGIDVEEEFDEYVEKAESGAFEAQPAEGEGEQSE